MDARGAVAGLPRAGARRLLALALAVLAIAPAYAGCAKADGPFTYYGRITDGRRFGATLAFADPSGSVVTGRLFVAPDYRDIAVEGTIAGRHELRLAAVETGKVVLEGAFVDSWAGRTGLGCDVVIGHALGEAALLQLDHIGGGGLALTPELAAMNAAALDVQRAVLAQRPDLLADHVRFPLQVTDLAHDARRMEIRGRAEFLRLYPTLIGPALEPALREVVPHDLFAHDDRSMMAAGRIWFDEDGDGRIESMSVGW